MFLITGISEAHIERNVDGALSAVKKNLKFMKPSGGNIAIPNSMWTAGCCIVPSEGAVGAFAVIGNNLYSETATNMFEATVPQLEDFLHIGVQGFGGKAIALFPGNPECSDFGNNIK